MANPSENFYYLPVTGRVVIGGKNYALMTFDILYTINKVPEARIGLPIGRTMSGAKEGSISNAMQFFSELKALTKVEVFLTIKSLNSRTAPPGSPLGFPDGKEFKIFSGRVMQPGMHKAFESSDALLTISALGEIGLLAGVSQYVYGLVEPTPRGTAPALMSLANNAGGDLYEGFNKFAPTVGDIWELLRSILEAVGAAENVFAETRKDQGFLLPILDTINVGRALPDAPMRLDTALTELSEDAKMVVYRSVAQVIGDAFFAFTGQLRSAADIWVLLEWLRNVFFFDIIAGVEETAIVSLVPTLQFAAPVTIKPSEYFTFAQTASYPPGMYAETTSVCLTEESTQTGIWQGKQPPAKIIGAYDINELLDTGVQGRMILRPMPYWALPRSAAASESLNKGNGFPDKGQTDAAADPAEQGDIETSMLNSSLGRSIAEMYLRRDLFESRLFSLSGRFRMDIAPGSQVKVITMGKRFTHEEAALYGMVRSVHLVGGVGRNGGSMSAEFTIGYIRSQAEQDTFCTNEHPLYSGGEWPGGKLLDF